VATRLLRTLIVLPLVVLAACGDDGGSAADPDGVAPTEVTAADIDGGIDLSADGPRSASGRVTIPGFDEVEVDVTTEAGEVVTSCLLLAAAAEQYTQGLMSVTELGDYAGMLFDFPEGERDGGFWMRDTALPLSIAYLDADGAIVSTADMDPCLDRGDECPSYPPDGPYADTVEVVQGGLEALGLDGPDARLVPTGPCAPL
jgi:uncharacterized membrane protein (UPF0127 family)